MKLLANKIGEMVNRKLCLGTNVFFIITFCFVLVGCATAVPTPTLSRSPATPTLSLFNHTMFVESQAEGFEMIKIEKPLDFTWAREVADSTGNYRAMEICNSYCDIFVEELRSGEVYRLAAPSLRRNRFFSDLEWSDKAILEFTLVAQPHHGVRFTVNIEASEIVNVVPMQLE